MTDFEELTALKSLRHRFWFVAPLAHVLGVLVGGGTMVAVGMDLMRVVIPVTLTSGLIGAAVYITAGWMVSDTISELEVPLDE